MRTFAALAFALSIPGGATAAQAQERQLFVYSGPSSTEVPATILRGTAPAIIEASPARKVRIVLQSPYGN